MKNIGSVGALGQVAGVGLPTEVVSNVPQSKGFSSILQSKMDAILGSDLYKDMTKFEQNLTSKRDMAPKELILYQVKASQLGLRVELLSKVGESMLTTVKKFQQGQ